MTPDATGAMWVLRLPNRWETLPVEADVLDAYRQALPDALVGDAAANAPGVVALFEALAADLTRGGVVLFAWTAQSVQHQQVDAHGTEPDSQSTEHQLTATVTLRRHVELPQGLGSPENLYREVAAPLELQTPEGVGSSRVDLVAYGRTLLLENRYRLPTAHQGTAELIGRSHNLELADEVIYLFATMADSLEQLD